MTLNDQVQEIVAVRTTFSESLQLICSFTAYFALVFTFVFSIVIVIDIIITIAITIGVRLNRNKSRRWN